MLGWLLLTVLISVLVLPFIDGMVIQKLWHWFVAPTFHLSELTLYNAIGLNLLFLAISFRSRSSETGKSSADMLKQAWGRIIQHFWVWGICLTFGAFIYMLGGGQ